MKYNVSTDGMQLLCRCECVVLLFPWKSALVNWVK